MMMHSRYQLSFSYIKSNHFQYSVYSFSQSRIQDNLWDLIRSEARQDLEIGQIQAMTVVICRRVSYD